MRDPTAQETVQIISVRQTGRRWHLGRVLDGHGVWRLMCCWIYGRYLDACNDYFRHIQRSFRPSYFLTTSSIHLTRLAHENTYASTFVDSVICHHAIPHYRPVRKARTCSFSSTSRAALRLPPDILARVFRNHRFDRIHVHVAE